jgi:hypothetical protein
MAGTIVSDTLQDGSGNSTATTNAIQGSAKAWVKFAGATGTVNASYNVSSITLGATGIYTVNFTSALTDANYSAIACASDGAFGALNTSIMFYTSGSYTASACTFYARNGSGGGYAPAIVSASFFR